MKKILFVALSFLFFFATPIFTYAQTEKLPSSPKQIFTKAKVLTVPEEGKRKIGSTTNIYQRVTLQILDGEEKGKIVTIEYGGIFTITESQKVHPGETVIVNKTIQANKVTYSLADRYRLDTLLYVLAGFFILVVISSGRKGFGSIFGMFISIAIIFWFIIPQIINGANPLLISIAGSLVIMITTIYLAHGFSQKTTIAVAATFISLVATAFLAIFCVNLAKLSGLGSEDAYTLLQGFQGKINLHGLLLGGIIIGTLGVLDDVTTTQTTTIFTLADANPKYTVKHLFQKGMIIGREHIASLVNTLVLAYAGASIGVFIFILLGIKNNTQPLWVMLNSEIIAEEVIRTLAGSIGLILAVPIATLLASFFAKHEIKIN